MAYGHRVVKFSAKAYHIVRCLGIDHKPSVGEGLYGRSVSLTPQECRYVQQFLLQGTFFQTISNRPIALHGRFVKLLVVGRRRLRWPAYDAHWQCRLRSLLAKTSGNDRDANLV